MYRVLVEVPGRVLIGQHGGDSAWDEMGHSDSFGECYEYARTLVGRVKIVGPEGAWVRNNGRWETK